MTDFTRKKAPTPEAKAAAVQVREEIHAALEAAIDNQWAQVMDHCQTAIVCAEHCQRIQRRGRKRKGKTVEELPYDQRHPPGLDELQEKILELKP